ncbi:YncE family protein [Alkalihalobacillus sp. NPDC078783]
MKRKWFGLSIIFSVLLFAGCNDQAIDVPDSENPVMYITHAKEATLSFLNTEQNKEIGSTELPYVLTDLIKLSDQSFVGINSSDTRIQELDLKSGKAQTFMELDAGMSKLAYDSSSDILYISNLKENRIDVVDVKAESKKSTLHLDSAPKELKLGENGLLYVLTTEEDEVIIYNPITDQIESHFSVNSSPAGMYKSTKDVWLGGHGSNGELNRNVYVYDPMTGEQTAEVEVGLMPIAITDGEQPNELFVLCHGDHSLYKINTETQEVVGKVEVGQNPNDVKRVGNTLYVANFDSDSISIIDANDLTLMKTVLVAEGPYFLLSEVDS